MKLTIAELAVRAGVSAMTVSRVLRGCDAGQVAPETAERIRELARSGGYRRKTVGAPRAFDPRVPVAVLAPENCYAFAPGDEAGGFVAAELLNGVIARAARLEERIEIFPCGDNPDANWKKLRAVPPRARVLALSDRIAENLFELARGQCRIAVVSEESGRFEYCRQILPHAVFAVAQTRLAARNAVLKLFQTGFPRVAVLAFEENMFAPGFPRLAGYRDALALFPRAPSIVIAVRGFNALRDRVAEVWKENPFDALLFHAPGAAWSRDQTLQKQLGIPDRVRIVNFIASPEYPDLPGTLFPWRQIGGDAFERLCTTEFWPDVRFYPGIISGF